MGTVELRHGDMFDGPSDLIVLPCSTAGTITRFVQEKLTRYGIPVRPEESLSLGDLRIHPFVGGESIAQFMAFAASVQGNHSTLEAIYRIGLQLGRHTSQMSSIRRVSAPLLGAGAGGLASEAAVGHLRKGFQEASHKDANLVISVLHDNVFRRVRESLGAKLRDDEKHTLAKHGELDKPPRVFVSYSHSTPEHQDWVKNLAEFLRQNGIDARLDAWHLRRGMDLPQFMTNELELADKVILVSDENYAEKADGRLGGVGWETMIVQGDISRLPPASTKYLVVVRSPVVDDGLPRYLKTKFVIHWPNKTIDVENRHLLLRELFDAIRVPAIGARPTYL